MPMQLMIQIHFPLLWTDLFPCPKGGLDGGGFWFALGKIELSDGAFNALPLLFERIGLG